MLRDATGRYDTSLTGGESVRAFVPDPLPPLPPLNLGGARQAALERATLALGRLDSIALLLPDPQLFLYAYVRREAVLSSQIEGTQSSLSDLLLFEMDELPGMPFDDVVEVSNYVAALEHGMARLRAGAVLTRPPASSAVGAGLKPAPTPAPAPATPAPATPASCRRLRRKSSHAWLRWKASSTAKRPNCRCC